MTFSDPRAAHRLKPQTLCIAYFATGEDLYSYSWEQVELTLSLFSLLFSEGLHHGSFTVCA